MEVQGDSFGHIYNVTNEFYTKFPSENQLNVQYSENFTICYKNTYIFFLFLFKVFYDNNFRFYYMVRPSKTGTLP